MGIATAVVTPELRDQLCECDDITIFRDEAWDLFLRFIEFVAWHAPDGRHVDIILDDRGLRFKPDADV
jgi:hypothetical protein